jgi:hypothetical protein
MVPSETTLDKTTPGLELNSLEAIICIGTPFAQQMPEVNKISTGVNATTRFRPVLSG